MKSIYLSASYSPRHIEGILCVGCYYHFCSHCESYFCYYDCNVYMQFSPSLFLFSPSHGKNLQISTPSCLWTKLKDTSSFSESLRRICVNSRVMTKSPFSLTGKRISFLVSSTVFCVILSPQPRGLNNRVFVSFCEFHCTKIVWQESRGNLIHIAEALAIHCWLGVPS